MFVCSGDACESNDMRALCHLAIFGGGCEWLCGLPVGLSMGASLLHISFEVPCVVHLLCIVCVCACSI